MKRKTGRAVRRAHKLRMKKKARRIYEYDGSEHLADHIKSCSCWMCGNARHWFGKDLDELRNIRSYEESIDDYYSNPKSK
jgi:hypothetical protein